MSPKKISFQNKDCWRIIPSRFPPISLFERVADEEDFEILYELESLTNNRLRNELGYIHLVPEKERVYGAGSGYIMAAFTHLNPKGSRFSDGNWGVYYAGLEFQTSIEETKYHRALFLSYTQEEPNTCDMRVLKAQFSGEFDDIYSNKEGFKKVYHLSEYRASQDLARKLKQEHSNGIHYQSVRHKEGQNIAIFKPNLIQNCCQTKHLVYCWDGHSINEIFEKKAV